MERQRGSRQLCSAWAWSVSAPTALLLETLWMLGVLVGPCCGATSLQVTAVPPSVGLPSPDESLGERCASSNGKCCHYGHQLIIQMTHRYPKERGGGQKKCGLLGQEGRRRMLKIFNFTSR